MCSHAPSTCGSASPRSRPGPHAFADDSSMSVLTGDSYAFFNDLDYNPGKFNTARAKVAPDRGTAMKMPQRPREAAQKPIMLADRPRITLQSPFRDDKGA